MSSSVSDSGSSRNWPGYYDVVILPSAEVRDTAIALSRRLRRAGGLWTLGRRAFLPHISLYHIPVRDVDVAAFLETLQSVVDDAEWGVLQTTDFDMPVLMTDKPEWLRRLQRRVVQRTVRFVDPGYRVENSWRLERFSGRRLKFARQYLRQFGSPMIGMNFRPHITLSSFAGEEPADLNFDVQPLRFKVDRLHVCELGQSHSCQRIVRELLPRRN